MANVASKTFNRSAMGGPVDDALFEMAKISAEKKGKSQQERKLKKRKAIAHDKNDEMALLSPCAALAALPWPQTRQAGGWR